MIFKIFSTKDFEEPKSHGMREVKNMKELEQLSKEFDTNSLIVLFGDDPCINVIKSGNS